MSERSDFVSSREFAMRTFVCYFSASSFPRIDHYIQSLFLKILVNAKEAVTHFSGTATRLYTPKTCPSRRTLRCATCQKCP